MGHESGPVVPLQTEVCVDVHRLFSHRRPFGSLHSMLQPEAILLFPGCATARGLVEVSGLCCLMKLCSCPRSGLLLMALSGSKAMFMICAVFRKSVEVHDPCIH